ncbi:MAG: hypothetical protein R6T91_01135, partial [Bacteroidales bacterium]
MKTFTFWKKISLILISLLLTISITSWAQCTHTLEMFDSYGDGWNGASVTVNVNGSPVLTNHTLSTGSSGTATFTASTG